MKTNKPGVNSLNWLLLMAWRDGRSGFRRLMLFMGSIVLGIAALVAIQNFGLTLEDAISGQSKELMGADYRVDTNQAPSEELLAILNQMPGTMRREINLATMIAFPDREGTRLIRLRGIESGYPYYGTLTTDPPSAVSDYEQWEGALVDAALMTQFNLKPGDFIAVGELTLPVAGAIELAPGNNAAATAVAPIVWIPFKAIDKTRLIQPGSRVGYNFYFQTAPDADLVQIGEDWGSKLDVLNADIDLHTDTSRRLGQRFENAGLFLKIIALVALLLGSLGIASSVNLYMKEKQQFIAILKCLGASRLKSLAIFLIQILGIGLLGGITGTLLGVGVQFVFPELVSDFLPVQLDWTVYPEPVAIGLFLGLTMAFLFGLLPLVNTWFISPLSALRIQENTATATRFISGLIGALIFLVLWLLAANVLNSAAGAFFYLIGLIIILLVLAGLSRVMMLLIRKYLRSSWSYEARQSLLNLFRPNNQTQVLILAIGFGSFLIALLYFTQDLLLAQAKLEENNSAANIIMLDVQSDQQKPVSALLREQDLPILENTPIVTMRLHRIKDSLVADIRADSASTINSWILTHEFRVTYRDSLIPSEKVKEGEWYNEYSGSGPIPISLSANVAQDAQVGIGDRLVFNVQGVLMETVLASIRDVDWGRVQLNFSVVFPSGVLEKAPQFHVFSTRVEDAKSSAQIQQLLVAQFPNITVLDIRQLIDVATGIFDKISWVIRFMAFLSILTGFIILLGAVRNSKFQRMRENVLLRTLGAKSFQIRRIVLLEYVLLGSIGSLAGVFLALFATELLAGNLFDMPFNPSWIPFGLLVPFITITVAILGLVNSRSIINSPPLEVLRREGV